MSPRAVAWLATDIGTGAWTDKGVPKGVVETKAELDACQKVINLDLINIRLSVCLCPYEKNQKIKFYPCVEHFSDTQFKNIFIFFALIKKIFIQTLVEIIFRDH